MRPIEIEDRVVWCSRDEAMRTRGSSGKVRDRNQDGSLVFVDWGCSKRTNYEPDAGWCKVGKQVVTPQVAARRGIEPWASSLERPKKISR